MERTRLGRETKTNKLKEYISFRGIFLLENYPVIPEGKFFSDIKKGIFLKKRNT